MIPKPTDEDLQQAFQRLAEFPRRDASVDPERIWRALSGELPADERRALVETLSRDPEAALAWRAASELWREAQAAPRLRRRSWTWPALAAAAVVVVGVLLVPLPHPGSPSPSPVLRDGAGGSVKLLIADGTSLPRKAFRLAWEPVAGDTRHVVRAITDDLALSYVARDVVGGEHVVPAERLEGLPSGTRVMWTVEARRGDGTLASSGTGVLRIAD